MQIISSYRQALPYLPAALQSPLSRLPAKEAETISEIRLRTGRALQTVIRGAPRFLTASGTLSQTPDSAIHVTQEQIEQTFMNICSHSLHSCQGALRQGFVTISGGCRAGLCGTAVLQGDSLGTIRSVSSINLRIASERIGCADALIARLGGLSHCGGTLLCGVPASGKTTLLRDICRQLGSSFRVSLLDERGELAAVRSGLPQFSVGEMTDVFDGYPKAESIAIAVRVMSPEYIICDEIGSEGEAAELLSSLRTGVQLIATAHAGSLKELFEREQIRRLMQAGAFQRAVLLGSGTHCGEVLQIEQIAGRAL